MTRVRTAADKVASPGTTFVEMVLAAFDQRWEKYRREFMRCRRKCSEKAVHDLRVATRRLLSVIDLIMMTGPDDRLAKIRQELRKNFRASGSLRDVQVQLVRLEKVRDRYPELEQFYTLLLLREKRLLNLMDKQLSKIPFRAMEVRRREVRTSIREALEARDAVAKTAAVGNAASRFLKCVSLLGAVDPKDPQTIHALRLAFKKFRYALEPLRGIIPGVTLVTLKAMNRYQVRMGAIQDIQVFSMSFRRYLTRVRKGSRITFLPYQQELTREREALVRDFLKGAGELHEFWSTKTHSRVPGPDQVMVPTGVN